MSTGPRLFISYSRVDQSFAMKLREDLRARGFQVWIDQHDIPAGADWDVTVEQALRQSDHVLVVLSPSSAESPRVRNEVALAEHEGKTLVPLLYETCDVPMNLVRRERIDFTTDYVNGFERLATKLGTGQVGGPVVAERTSRIARAGITITTAGVLLLLLLSLFNTRDKGAEDGPQRPRVERPARSTTSPSSVGRKHPDHAHVVAGPQENEWLPEEGYEWVDSGAPGDFRVKWAPGRRHRQHPYVFTSETEGRWIPATGYTFINPDDPKDLRVKPLSP